MKYLNEVGDFVGGLIKKLHKGKEQLLDRITSGITQLKENDKVIYQGKEYRVYAICPNYLLITVTVWLRDIDLHEAGNYVFSVSDFRDLIKVGE